MYSRRDAYSFQMQLRPNTRDQQRGHEDIDRHSRNLLRRLLAQEFELRAQHSGEDCQKHCYRGL